jgi:integrase
MAVRKRAWKTKTGQPREVWVVDYADSQGDRHIRSFPRKKEADAFHASVNVEVRLGIHTSPNKSPTVSDAAALYFETCQQDGLERTTLDTYREHIELHIVPFLGSTPLSELTLPMVRDFIDQLRRAGRSPAMVKKVLVRLGSMLADAQERGLVAQNVVRNLKARRRKGRDRQVEARARGGKLKVGINIPTPAEIQSLIAQLRGRWRPLLLTAIFTGLRASELRALSWRDVDLKRGELHVRRRADRYNAFGPPKSEAGERTIPLPPILLKTLKEHRLASTHDLVFGNGRGNIENWGNIINRGFHPAQVAAGIVQAPGKAKYTGLHSMRHFYASWCINRRADGGLELPLKLVQARMGHSTITMTADTYGHLFPRNDDGSELAAAERGLHAT